MGRKKRKFKKYKDIRAKHGDRVGQRLQSIAPSVNPLTPEEQKNNEKKIGLYFHPPRRRKKKEKS